MKRNCAAATFWMVMILFSLPELDAQEGFRVYPYLQSPAPDAITVLWFSDSPDTGVLAWQRREGGPWSSLESEPGAAPELARTLWEDTTYFGGEAPPAPYRHRIRIGGLDPGTRYNYIVTQGADQFSSSFRTAPEGNDTIRFMVYADSETEPESTGKAAVWADPVTTVWRSYLVDQTTGYANNLAVIRSRGPDLVFVAGDLVQYGGVQRHWDEFWRHNTDSTGAGSLAGNAPVHAAPGNHEYYEGPELDGYNQPGSERAIRRYLAYFDPPANGSTDPEQEGRYYALRYGPATFIILDLCNNGPSGTEEDTNFPLLGESDPLGGHAPDFREGSTQYLWLEEQLSEAQKNALFTFLIFHHPPYSSGPHGFPAGTGESYDIHSGVPVRALTPLLMKYGVDAVFSGHDEMWERSPVPGLEILPDGTEQPHTIQFYDVGIGGDGLREPAAGTDNPFRAFLAHTDSPEVWDGEVLLEGGKHYGHLEVNIFPVDDRSWQAVLDPVYVLPLFNAEDSAWSEFERRVYDDRVILTWNDPTAAGISRSPDSPAMETKIYPNPFRHETTIAYHAPDPVAITIVIADMTGREVRTMRDGGGISGMREMIWDGRDNRGRDLPPAPYFVRTEQGSGSPGIILKQ